MKQLPEFVTFFKTGAFIKCSDKIKKRSVPIYDFKLRKKKKKTCINCDTLRNTGLICTKPFAHVTTIKKKLHSTCDDS